jgi:hypothetical protein
VCSATAFVGERLEAGRRVEAEIQVPSALPEGWSAQFAAAAPMTARPAPMVRALNGDSLTAMLGRSATFAKHLVPPNASPPGLVVRYRGVPDHTDKRGVLVGGVVGIDIGPRLSRLRASLGGTDSEVDKQWELWICVDDDTSPVVQVALRELLALGGERPLNVALQPGARVEILLIGAERVWPETAGELIVELS